jgi:broad specificity phosphatase PhoE
VRIYCARHGESEANLLREFSNRGLRHGLTERGREQARALADKLRGAPIERIYSSPLLRALESAEVVAERLGAPVEVTPALREWDVGVLEGRCDDAAWAEYWALRRAWAAGAHDRKIDDGESLVDIERRFASFMEQMVAAHPRDAEVLLVAHGGLYAAALPRVLANVDAAFAEAHPLDHASLVEIEPANGVMVCPRWGDVELARDPG